MSMRCEDVRPLLAELVYEEVDPRLAEELREHLGTCLSCRRHQMAFLAVRKDLNEWKPAEDTASSGITFIAPGAHLTTPIWHSRLFQGLAIAASFMFGAFLIAAVVNLQVQSGPDGWVLSTSFSDQTLEISEPAPETPDFVPVDKILELDSWLEGELSALGVAYTASLPSNEELTPPQMRLVSRRSAEITADLIGQVIAERDAQHEDFLRQLVATSLDQHSADFSSIFVNVIDELEARRVDAIVGLWTEFYDTRRRVDEANYRIDTLDNLVTQVAAPIERRNPEQ